jgi:hypothetical protein
VIRLSEGIFIENLAKLAQESPNPQRLSCAPSETAQALLQLVNIIIEEMITKPNAVAALYSSLPKPKRDAITVRDK